MSARQIYEAIAERDEAGWWSVSVPALPGVFTQARRLDQVEGLVADAIALWLEEPADSFDIEVTPRLADPELDRAARDARASRAEAEAAAERAALQVREVAQYLDRMGFTRRDSAALLGVSHQRVQQILPASKARKKVKA